MTLTELIEQAQDLATIIGEEAAEMCEIRFAVNPAWPMQHEVKRLMLVDESTDDPAVYLVDAGQVPNAPYLPVLAQEQMGW